MHLVLWKFESCYIFINKCVLIIVTFLNKMLINLDTIHLRTRSEVF